MAIKNMIVRGRVGFDAGDVKFIFTHGLAIGEPPSVTLGPFDYTLRFFEGRVDTQMPPPKQRLRGTASRPKGA